MVIKHFVGNPFVETDNIGVFSFSIGITIAAGALAKYSFPFVKYLFDWEGPSNRLNITKNDTFKPFRDYPSSNLKFWRNREAARFIGKIRCGYFRYQAARDHMQGRYKGHSIELLNLATNGKAAWTRLNDNPPNMLFDDYSKSSYKWIPLYDNHKSTILKYFLEAHSEADSCTRL